MTYFFLSDTSNKKKIIKKISFVKKDPEIVLDSNIVLIKMSRQLSLITYWFLFREIHRE